MARTKMRRTINAGEDNISLALYCRVSTEKQAEEGHSIQVQMERLEAYGIAKFGSECHREFYIDDGYSGGSLDRPEMKRLIQQIRKRNISHVLVYKLDRLSRSQKDTLYLIEDVFLDNNVEFMSLQEAFDTSSAYGRAMIGMLSVFAQLERENIFERTRLGMQKRVELGFWPGGGGTPFGYDYNPISGNLELNEDSPKVPHIYELYLQGLSTQAIANMVGLSRDRHIHNILTRKTYCGVIPYNGVEYQGKHPPLITEEVFDKVQKMLHDRSQRKPPQKADYLLTGLCYCMNCGAKMRYQRWGKDKIKLVCYSQQTSKKYLIKDPNCDNPKPWASDIEKAVLEDFFSFAEDIVEDERPKEERRHSIIEQLKLQRIAEEAKRKKVLKMIIAEEEDSERDTFLKDELLEIKRNILAIDTQIANEQLKSEIANEAEKVREELKTVKSMWSKMTQVERMTILRRSIESIKVGPDSLHIDYKV